MKLHLQLYKSSTPTGLEQRLVLEEELCLILLTDIAIQFGMKGFIYKNLVSETQIIQGVLRHIFVVYAFCLRFFYPQRVFRTFFFGGICITIFIIYSVICFYCYFYLSFLFLTVPFILSCTLSVDSQKKREYLKLTS